MVNVRSEPDPFGDEPATELMEMPTGVPVPLVELGAEDLEPWDEGPSAPRRPPRGAAPGIGRPPARHRAAHAITAPIPELELQDEPDPFPREPRPLPAPRPLPVLFGGRSETPRFGRVQRPPVRAAPSRRRWVANAVALASAWGVLLLLGLCLALAVMARAG